MRNYVQPSLAFYERVFDHARPNAARIVFQNRLNPVLDELVKVSKRRSITCTKQSHSLKEDIESLAGAHTLVTGRGTIAPAIVRLSPHIKKSISSRTSLRSSPTEMASNSIECLTLRTANEK